MIKIDRNISVLWQIVLKKYNFNISIFVGFIVWIPYWCRDMNIVKGDIVMLSVRQDPTSRGYYHGSDCLFRNQIYVPNSIQDRYKFLSVNPLNSY